MSRRPLMFGTNWKMHKTAAEASHYAVTLRDLLGGIEDIESVQVFVLPSYTAIAAVKESSGGKFLVGAQNMHSKQSGPYTGEISAPMLTELGIDIVQLGHAERREMYNESDAAINEKVHAALLAGFRPLICIGESRADREFSVERDACAYQLRIALKDVMRDAIHRTIIGYEPAWAIGENGTIADAQYVHMMKDHFRAVLGDMFGSDSAERVPILYGGSVSEDGAARMLIESDVDGLFVGRAALDPTAFASLIAKCLLEYKARSRPLLIT